MEATKKLKKLLLMIEFKVKYENQITKEKGSLEMILKGLAFYFLDANKNPKNPFFYGTEETRTIAKELFKEDSILINNPKSVMNFRTGALSIEVTSEDL